MVMVGLPPNKIQDLLSDWSHNNSLLIEYPELNLKPLNKFKPSGELDSFVLRMLDSGVGISIEGIASNISFYGFDKAEFQQIEYVYHSLHDTSMSSTL